MRKMNGWEIHLARQKREWYPGAVYHVMSRGNRRLALFKDDEDYLDFLFCILPGMTEQEALEVTKIHSIAGLLDAGGGLIKERPFRAPHHNVSLNALIGGGSYAQPGEVSLAHNGVLFLDELAELNIW